MNYKLRANFSTDPDYCVDDVLRQRGVENIYEFKNPEKSQELSPYKLDNVCNGAKMLIRHLENPSSKICICVDSDCDGVTSSAIMWNYIKERYPNADLHYSVHEGKVHGIDDKVDEFIDGNYDLIIVPDAGSNQKKEMQALCDAGIDLLIIDHHVVEFEGYDWIPSNTVVINNQQSKNYTNKTLCGAGVVYKFCEVLDDIFGEEEGIAGKFIDLAMLGEVADVMSKTTSETNYIMETGLKNIQNKGLVSLLEAQSYQLKDKAYYPYDGLTTTDIAFYISPLINAIVRVGSKAENEALFQLFINPDMVVPSTKRGALIGSTETIGEQVARMATNCRARQNREKQRADEIIEQKIQENCLYENNIIIVELDDDDDVRNTLTGLICTNFVEKYNRPVLIGRVSSDGRLRGSIRGKDTFSAIPDLQSYLLSTGYFNYVQGHPNSAGFSIPYGDVEKLIEKSNSAFSSDDFSACYQVDYVLEANFSNLNKIGMAFSSCAKYFGNGVDEVKVCIKNIPMNNVMLMGKDKDSSKIIYNNVSYVRFKDFDFAEKTQEKDSTVDVIGRFNLNTFNGETYLQVLIDDYKFSEKINKYDF